MTRNNSKITIIGEINKKSFTKCKLTKNGTFDCEKAEILSKADFVCIQQNGGFNAENICFYVKTLEISSKKYCLPNEINYSKTTPSIKHLNKKKKSTNLSFQPKQYKKTGINYFNKYEIPLINKPTFPFSNVNFKNVEINKSNFRFPQNIGQEYKQNSQNLPFHTSTLNNIFKPNIHINLKEKICPNCNTKNKLDIRYCKLCGYKFF